MSNKKPQGSSNNQANKPVIDYYAQMIGRYHRYLDAKDSGQKKSALTLWSIIAVILLAASCVPLPQEFRVLSAIVGTPAGIIIWFILAGLFRETRLRDTKLGQLKDTYSPMVRKRAVLVGLAAFIILGVFASTFIPYGVGGIIAVIAALFCFYFLSKTDEEKKLDEYGLPDPRDYQEFYDELENTENEEEYEYEEYGDYDSDDIDENRR